MGKQHCAPGAHLRLPTRSAQTAGARSALLSQVACCERLARPLLGVVSGEGLAPISACALLRFAETQNTSCLVVTN